jgi:hypothetical protein
MNWKEQFDEEFTHPWRDKLMLNASSPDEIKDFISIKIIRRLIEDLETNPNSDGSQSPNIPHWIESKQQQLRDKWL